LAKSPPRRDAAPERFAVFRSACLQLLCLSGLSGCPQLAFPLVNCAGHVSLSLLVVRSADRMLMHVARRLRAE
ncbi:amidase, partial [Rhizobium ruizarguesonis]